MTGIIYLTAAGLDTGPFDIYSDVDGYVAPFGIGILKSTLISGWATDAIPQGTLGVRIQSINANCTNYAEITEPFTALLKYFDNYIVDVKVIDDCKLFVYGGYNNYGPVSGRTNARGISIINTCGIIEEEFATNIGTGLTNDTAYQSQGIAIADDGSIFIGAWFTLFNGQSYPYFVKLQRNGLIDTSFVVGTGFNNFANIPLLDDDGSVYVTGRFTTWKGVGSTRLIKLDQYGDVIPAFNVGAGFNNVGQQVLEAGNDQIWVHGYYTVYNGASSNHITLINKADATQDMSFNVGSGPNNSGNSKPMLATTTPEEGLIVVSSYGVNSYNGTPTGTNIFKIDRTGALDAVFMANIGTGFDAAVYNIMYDDIAQKYVLGTWASSLNGVPIERVLRLNLDGTVDATFNFDGGGSVYTNGIRRIGDYYYGPFYRGPSYETQLFKISMDGSVHPIIDTEQCNNDNPCI